MHPILNIEHLEKYQESPKEFGEQPTIKLKQMDFGELPEYQVDHIVAESWHKGRNGKQIPFIECSIQATDQKQIHGSQDRI